MADEETKLIEEKAMMGGMPKAGGFTAVTNIPMPSKEEGQRSINITDLFITRWTPPWSRPPSLPAYTWRAWVLNQPVAEACREVLISLLIGLEWNITAREQKNKDDLQPTIDYYVKLLNHGGYYLGTDFSGLLEWVVGDLLDIPFGGAVEVGRRDDKPNGRVAWLRPLDGGTMYPTLNKQFPAVQYYQGYTAVPFPSHAIARIYMTPRPEIFREGWGIAPPEKIYFALDMLNRGDKYYANLMLDIPPAGLLDLGDFEKESALEWVEQFRGFIAGTTDAWRIPILYEHNNEVKFIPFGKLPNEIMYDHITNKYAALICAAYGLSLNDIGLQTTSRGGETLAGSIRSQSQTRRTGIARLKQKVKSFIEKILPPTLQFDWIDYDDEHNVAMGRARLASSTALNMMVINGSISREEARMQMLADGLMSISVGDKPPTDAKPMNTQNAPKNISSLGHGVPPSMGGEGEIKSLVFRSTKASENRLDDAIMNLTSVLYQPIMTLMSVIGDEDLKFSESIIALSVDSYFGVDIEPIIGKEPIMSLDAKSIARAISSASKFHSVELPEKERKKLEDKLKGGVNGLLAKAIVNNIAGLLYDTQVREIDEYEVNWEEEVADVVDTNYNYIVQETKSRVQRDLPILLTNWVSEEIQRYRS